VLQGCGKLRGSMSHFLATTSSQINIEAANDVDPKYQLNPCFIVSIQVRVGDVWVGIVWARILIFVWLYSCRRVVMGRFLMYR